METQMLVSGGPGSGKLSVPFYEPQPGAKRTSSEIINEARAAVIREPKETVRHSRMLASVRPVNTKRPFTPRERQRTLFGTCSRSGARPPSTFSLGYLSRQDDPCTPPSPCVRRLHPLPHPSSHNPKLNPPAYSQPHTAQWRSLFEASGGGTLFEVSGGGTLFEAREPLGTVDERSHRLWEVGRLESLGNAASRLVLPSIRTGHYRVSASLDNLPEELETEDDPPAALAAGSHQRKELHACRLTRSSPVQRTRSIDSELRTLAEVSRSFLGSPVTHSASIIDDSINTSIQHEGGIAVAATINHSNTRNKKRKAHAGRLFVNSQSTEREEDVPHSDESQNDFDLFDVERWKSDNVVGGNVSTESGNVGGGNVSTESRLQDAGGDAADFDVTSSKVENVDEELRNVIRREAEGGTDEFEISKPRKELVYEDVNILEAVASDAASAPNESAAFESTASEDAAEERDAVASGDRFVGGRADDRQPTEAGEHKLQTPRRAFGEVQGEVSKHNAGTSERPESVASIIAALNVLAESDGNDPEVLAQVSALYTALEREGAIGAHTVRTAGPKVKSSALKCVYAFVERSDASVLLAIARIVLAFRVCANNLSAVCKLVFKVARCDANDRLFAQDNVLELFLDALGSASPLEDPEACVYGYGALKFLTMNPTLLTRVIDLGTLELMVLHMKVVNSERSDGALIPEQTSHALFQLTGALRNIAGESDMFPRFVSSGAVAELCRAMELFSADLDLISNVSRTVSIVSTDDECCCALVGHEGSLRVFVTLFRKYPGRRDIVVRLGYALGNIMARSDDARIKFHDEEGAMDALLNILTIYVEKDSQLLGSAEIRTEMPDSDSGSDGSIEDVIVKVIRIVANMSINPMVGTLLACSTENTLHRNNIHCSAGESGGVFLDLLLALLRRKSSCESPDLILGVLSTLNNLSYYPTGIEGALGARQMEFAGVLGSLLTGADPDCLVEVNRVLGNLTRTRDTRDYLRDSGGFSHLVGFLSESDDLALVSAATGVLINMMSDPDKRSEFGGMGGVGRLVGVLEAQGGRGEWELCALACQALWNYCVDADDLQDALGAENVNLLLAALIDCLDEERLFGIAEGAEVPDCVGESQEYQLWDAFAAVATNLMEKIESYLDAADQSEVCVETEVFDRPSLEREMFGDALML